LSGLAPLDDVARRHRRRDRRRHPSVCLRHRGGDDATYACRKRPDAAGTALRL